MNDMELQHINVKLFVDGTLPVGLDRFVEVFHRWTAAQSLDELLIDVADYAHIPAGPGIVLIGHEADYALDQADNRWGILYNRKAAVSGTNGDRLQQALFAASHICALLESEFADESLKFDRHRLQVLVNDRGLAPNNVETLEACRPDLAAFADQVFGSGQWQMDVENEPRRRFAVEFNSSSELELATPATS